MRALLVGVALLALAAPVAHAQQGGEPPAAAVSGQAEPGRFLVYFGFDKATLDASARRVVAMAADEYKRTGAAQITVTGHADKAGRAEYNQRLSERRSPGPRATPKGGGGPSTTGPSRGGGRGGGGASSGGWAPRARPPGGPPGARTPGRSRPRTASPGPEPAGS